MSELSWMDGGDDHSYHFKGDCCRAGYMVCPICNKRIDTETSDWRSLQVYTRSYRSEHRGCVNDQSPWLRLEDKATRHLHEVEHIKALLKTYKDVHNNWTPAFKEAALGLGLL